jgi:hypothetical protein
MQAASAGLAGEQTYSETHSRPGSCQRARPSATTSGWPAVESVIVVADWLAAVILGMAGSAGVVYTTMPAGGFLVLIGAPRRYLDDSFSQHEGPGPFGRLG